MVAKDWESVQEDIRKHYQDENKPLLEVMRLIKESRGFDRS